VSVYRSKPPTNMTFRHLVVALYVAIAISAAAYFLPSYFKKD